MSDWSMGFREDDEQDDVAEPVGFGPPEDQLPGVVPVEVVLGRSPDVAVLLTGRDRAGGRPLPTAVDVSASWS